MVQTPQVAFTGHWPEMICHCIKVAQSLVRPLGAKALQQAGKFSGNIVILRCEIRKRVKRMRHDFLERMPLIGLLEWCFPGGQFAKGAAQAVNIGPEVGRVGITGLLGGQIIQRADDLHALRQSFIFHIRLIQ